MCNFLSKSGGVPFQPLGDLTRSDPACNAFKCSFCINNMAPTLLVSGDIQAKILDKRLTTMTPYANHF